MGARWKETMHRAAALTVTLLALSSLLLACEGGAEPFRSCSLDPILREPGTQRCTGATGTEATETCVFASHPQCPDGVCLVWHNSAPFCSSACQGDGDCPPDSSCQAPPAELGNTGEKYCVPNVLPQPVGADAG